MASYNEITPTTLMRLIGTPARPTIIDVRIDEDFSADPFLVPGSVRHPFTDVAALAETLRGQSAIVYCQKGLKISQGAAAVLRTEGVQAEVLEGGQIAWRDAGLPMVEADTLPRARFLFVSPSQVMNVAERFMAAPFDIEDTFWSHRGERCTFDTMIEEFGIGHDALNKLALIVRAADTNRHDLAPEAPGLLAASLGLSRMFRDDLEQLGAGILLYDAYYRWARDATDEGHDWPASSKA